jgi:hypothetical protein
MNLTIRDTISYVQRKWKKKCRISKALARCYFKHSKWDKCDQKVAFFGTRCEGKLSENCRSRNFSRFPPIPLASLWCFPSDLWICSSISFQVQMSSIVSHSSCICKIDLVLVWYGAASWKIRPRRENELRGIRSKLSVERSPGRREIEFWWNRDTSILTLLINFVFLLSFAMAMNAPRIED